MSSDPSNSPESEDVMAAEDPVESPNVNDGSGGRRSPAPHVPVDPAQSDPTHGHAEESRGAGH